MMVHFIRTYMITNKPTNNGLIKNGSFEDNNHNGWLWHGEVSPNTLSTNVTEGAFNLNLKNGGSIIQKINILKNKNYVLNLSAKVNLGFVKIEIIKIDEKSIFKNDWNTHTIKFNSGTNTELFLRVSSSSNSDVFVDTISLH